MSSEGKEGAGKAAHQELARLRPQSGTLQEARIEWHPNTDLNLPKSRRDGKRKGSF